MAALVLLALELGSCSALRFAQPADIDVYGAVLATLASQREVDGMRISAWLSEDLLDGCDSPELRDWLKGAIPGATDDLVANFCTRRKRPVSLSPSQVRMLEQAIPPSEVEGHLREISFSAVGYGQNGALVFVRRQLNLSCDLACDVGEYYFLQAAGGEWRVVSQGLRWIS